MRPTWSPDGERIAFNSDRDGNLDVYLMAADGSDVTRITKGNVENVFPEWSPDGKRLAYFRADVVKLQAALHVIDLEQKEELVLGDMADRDEDPAWSPDGRHLVFQSERDGNFEIYIVKADGTGARRLTDSPAGDYWPDWGPTPSEKD